MVKCFDMIETLRVVDIATHENCVKLNGTSQPPPFSVPSKFSVQWCKLCS